MVLCSSALLSACLPEDKDPDREARAVEEVSVQYASTLGNIAVRAQDIILKDSSWFSNVSGATLDLASYGVVQPHGPSATIRTAACPTGSTGRLRQITWLDANDGAGNFTVPRLGNSSGAILAALRNSVSGSQAGTYRGDNAIEMTDGNILSIPQTCHSLSLPLNAPVVVFSIDRPASPAVAVSKKEFRSVACPPDASGHPQRGALVQTRVITFGPSGFNPSPSSDTGWQTDDMGQCIEDASFFLASRDNLAGGGTGVLSGFANSSMRDLLAAQIEMDCSKTQVAGTKREGTERVSSGFTVDTCAKSAAQSDVALDATLVGTEEVSRELVCSGSFDNPAAQIGNIALSGSRVTWEPRPGFSNKATLKQSRTAYDLNASENNQSLRGKWVAGDINCAGTETATLACTQVPGAPIVAGGGSSTIDVMKSDYEVPSSAPSLVSWSRPTVYVLNNEFFKTSLEQNGGLTLQRTVSATRWKDPTAFIPAISGGDWRITENQCTWKSLKMGDCPTQIDASMQGSWYPTASLDTLNWSFLTTDHFLLRDQQAPSPERVDASFLAQTRPWTIDTPVTAQQANDNTAAWAFRDLQQKGQRPTRVMTLTHRWPDDNGNKPTPGYNGQMYLKRWMTNGTQPSTTVQTTLLNTQGVQATFKPIMRDGAIAIAASDYSPPLYCARTEERVIEVPYKRFSCGGALLEEKSVKIVFSSYRRYRAAGTTSGSWSRPVYSYAFDPVTDANLQFLISTRIDTRFNKGLEAGSRYVSGEGNPILPREGFRYEEECTPEQPTDFCPALTTPSCAANEIVVNIPIFQPGGMQLGNCTQNVCAPVETPPVVTPQPVQCPAVTQPVCTGFTHFVASPNDANGCTTAGKCERNACPALGNAPQNQADCDRQEPSVGATLWYVDGGTDSNGCARAGHCRQETFEECVIRDGGYIYMTSRGDESITNLPSLGCCEAYNNFTSGGCERYYAQPDPNPSYN